jgi:ArsR family transcriptional regulator
MADTFKVLGDPNRLHILSLISHQELCVCEITSILNISQSNASQHLARLRSVDLVKERRNAQWIYYLTESGGISIDYGNSGLSPRCIW